MPEKYNLNRFLEAQERDYVTALSEIKNGRKRSHWMWYIFPQMQGLGFSQTSIFYAIKDLKEVQAYFNHPILGSRLKEICNALLQLESNNATSIFGSPDDLKLKSSMTLFAALHADSIFESVLQKFFRGSKDEKTLQILKSQE